MNTETTKISEAGVVAELARRAVTPMINVKREGVAILPSGQVINLENELLADHPRRKRAAVKLIEQDSFVEYLRRFMIEGRTIIFGEATETGGKVQAIVDYHDVEQLVTALSGEAAALAQCKLEELNQPHWGEHTVGLTLTTTPEWQRWLANNGKLIAQEQFAEFIEDNGADIVAPDAGALLDMALFLQGKKTVQFKSGRNLGNGAQELVYSESIEETSGRRDDTTKFPTHMVVKLRPFVGSAGVDIPARLRFRISDGGKLSLQYLLDRPWRVVEAAFVQVCTEIETELGVPVMLGSGAVSAPQHIAGA